MATALRLDLTAETSPVAGTIGLASDDALVSSRIQGALARAGLNFIGPNGSVGELAEEAARRGSRLDVLVLRSGAGRAEHLSEIRQLQEVVPETKLVIVRPSTEREARRLLQLGVRGLVDEAEIDPTIAPTVLAVLAGQVCAPSRVHAHVNGDALSAREKQVLGMVVMGFSNGEIALKLHLAESTVKSHLSSSFGKLGVRSRKEAAALILDPEEGLGPGILTLAGL